MSAVDGRRLNGEARMGKARILKPFRSAALIGVGVSLVLSQSMAAIAAPTFPTSSNRLAEGGSAAATYLALGDSLAAGVQPNRGITPNGYVNQLWRSLRESSPQLKLRNVACPGETSRSLITGERSPCQYDAGSQLDTAVEYIDAHPGQVELITLDVGANDLLNRCMRWKTGLIDRPCTKEQRPRLKSRLKLIVDTLSAEVGPGIPIVAMTYYNPFLGFWGHVPGGRALARADQRAWVTFNAGIRDAYQHSGAAVARVDKTFRINDFKHTRVLPGLGRVPINVALACSWTWFCSHRFFMDPHANRTGYQKIARTFERKLNSL